MHCSNDTVMTTTNGSITLKANSLKYTLTIEDWKYMYQNSKLAIVQTVHTVGFRQVENNAIVNSSVTMGTPYYSWNATAIADGAAISVDAQNFTAYSGSFGFAVKLATAEAAEGASWYSNAETFDIYVFSFDKVQPQKIVWDPVLGLDDGMLSLTFLLLFSILFSIIRLLTFLIFFYRSSRRTLRLLCTAYAYHLIHNWYSYIHRRSAYLSCLNILFHNITHDLACIKSHCIIPHYYLSIYILGDSKPL